MFNTTRRPRGAGVTSGLLLLAVLVATVTEAQLRHSRGQNVAPVFEGWQHNDDGTFTFFFGYMNRNHEEIVDLPVGRDNFLGLSEFPNGILGPFGVFRG